MKQGRRLSLPRQGDGRSGMRTLARFVPWLLPAVVACQSGTPRAPSLPAAGALDLLGWEAPPEALAVRNWSEEALAQAPLWTLAEPPTGVVVPDTVETRDGRLFQRYVSAGTVLPSGDVVLLLVDPTGPTRGDRGRSRPAARGGCRRPGRHPPRANPAPAPRLGASLVRRRKGCPLRSASHAWGVRALLGRWPHAAWPFRNPAYGSGWPVHRAAEAVPGD